MSTPGYYQHSGKVPVLGVLLTSALAVSAALLLATVYAYAILYIPIRGYVTFILSGGFGFLMGIAVVSALEKGKLRNAAASLALGAAVTLFAFYAHWVIWTYAILRRGDVDVSLAALWLNPGSLWAVIQRINELGSVSVRDIKPTGAFLYGFWGLEFLLIAVPALIVVHGAGRRPFCEGCDAWSDQHEGAHALNLRDVAEVKAAAETKDFAALASFGAAPADAGYYVRVDLTRCPKCDRTNTVSLHAVTAEVDSKGTRTEKVDLVVDRLLLDAAEFERARTMAPTS